MKIKICSILCITTLLLTNKSFGQFVITPAVTNSNPLSTDGNAGIGTGTSLQAAKLHIASATNQLRLANGTYYSVINTNSVGNLVFTPSGTGKIGFGAATPLAGVGFHSNMGVFRITDPTTGIRGLQVSQSFPTANGDIPAGTMLSTLLSTAGEGLSFISSGSGNYGFKIGAYADNPSAGGWKSMWETENTNGVGQIPKLLLVKNGGNVGIGTGATAPDKLLTVKSTVANRQIAKFGDNARYIGIGRDEVAAFDLIDNPANLYLGGLN